MRRFGLELQFLLGEGSSRQMSQIVQGMASGQIPRRKGKSRRPRQVHGNPTSLQQNISKAKDEGEEKQKGLRHFRIGYCRMYSVDLQRR